MDTHAAQGPTRILTALRDRAAHLWLPLALLVEGVLTLVDIGWGPWSVVGFEEGRNARAALKLACGHADRLLDLQYRDFCGGCTADAVLAAPLLRHIGDAVWVWKLVPAGFHLLLVAAVGALVRVAGPRQASSAGVLAVAVLAASPWSLRELALTGWGNHAEVRGLVMAAAVLLLVRSERRWLVAVYSLLAGIVAGLSVWYAHIAVHALPALMVVAAFRRAAGLPFVAGLPLGLLPLGVFLSTRPTAAQGAEAMWGGLQLAPIGATLTFLLGPLEGDGWWPSSVSWPGGLAVGTAILGASWGLFSALRTPSRRTALFGLLSVAGFVAAVWLRKDLWADVPTDAGYAPFHLRYRAVLWPLVAVGLGVWARHHPRRAWWVAAPLLVCGLGWRVVAWSNGPAPRLGLSVWSEPGRPDATVPEGQPLRRRPWGLDRTVDLTAAQAFVQGHHDVLAACREDHLGELGRRAGLQATRGGRPQLSGPTHPAIVAGIAWALTRQGRELDAPAIAQLPPDWQAPVRTQAVRLVPETSLPDALPGTSEGRCIGHADRAWRVATEEGRSPPSHIPSAPDACPEPEWTHALARVRQERAGCTSALKWPDCP